MVGGGDKVLKFATCGCTTKLEILDEPRPGIWMKYQGGLSFIIGSVCGTDVDIIGSVAHAH